MLKPRVWPWAGRSRLPAPGSYLVEPLPFARISLPEIPRFERCEYVGHFFSLISPPLLVL